MQVSRAFSCFGVPRGRPMPPAHCIPAAGPAPRRPVSQCYGFPRSRFPGSATSCAALCLGLPPRTRLWRSRARVHSKVVDASCPIVVGLDSTAAGASPQPGLVAERFELKPKSKTNTKKQRKASKMDSWSKCTLHTQPGSKAPLVPFPVVPLFTPGWRSRTRLSRPPSATCRERGGRGVLPRAVKSVAPQEAGPIGVGHRPARAGLPTLSRGGRLPPTHLRGDGAATAEQP